MRQLPHLLTLLFLFVQLNGKAQTDVQHDKRVDPVLKQVDAKLPGLKIFRRKDGKGGYVNMAVLDANTRQLKWFTCHGLAFDSVQLRDNEYNELFASSLDPFTFYRNYCYENLFYIEHAEIQYRLLGKDALQDTSYNSRVVFNAAPVKSAQSTLQKLMAIEGLMKRISLQLRLFDSRAPMLLGKSRNDSSRIRRDFAGVMIRKADSTVYYNTNPLATAAKIVLRQQSPDRLFVYNQEGALMDSVSLKPGKYASLLKEKEDVFLLYRGWLELQWQQVADSKQQYAGWLRKLDSSLYMSVAWEQSKLQLENVVVSLREQQNLIDDKISSLIVPEEKYVEQLIADVYKNELSEISYLTGLGFAYTISYIRGQKAYELTDHRGNVMTVVSDKKKGIDGNSDGIIEYYNADVVNSSDYYPFGALMPGRIFSADNKYRYGYNGKENDNEIKGEGNQQDYGKRVYDPRLGRFLSVDPLQAKYPNLTPYQFASNSPIANIDLDGLEKYHYALTFDNQGNTQIKLSNVEHFSEWQWNPKWGGTNLGFQLWEKVEDPKKEYIVEYSFQDYLVVGVAAEPVTTTYKVTFNSESEALNAKFSDFDASIIKGDIAKGLMAGSDIPGIPTRRARLTPNAETNKQAKGAHGGNENAVSANQKVGADKWKDFDFEEKVTVYHKGNLEDGKVSSNRPLSTGTDREKVNSIRNGKLYEFKIPKDLYNQWRNKDLIRTYQDLDHATGVINQEIRFDRSLADQLNKYMTNNKNEE